MDPIASVVTMKVLLVRPNEIFEFLSFRVISFMLFVCVNWVLLAWRGTSSVLEWKRRPPGVKSSFDYIEEWRAETRHRVLFQQL
jgi:hypothetical protein